MQIKTLILQGGFLFISIFSQAQKQSDTAAIVSARAWWHAVTFGDTAYVRKHSTDQLTVTFNSGRSFNHKQILAQVGTHDPRAAIKAEWSQVSQQLPTAKSAIVTSRVEETLGKTLHVYKFITVLARIRSQWIVAAAQSTREIQLAPAVPLSEVGNLSDFTGGYKTPAGMILKMAVKDSSLVLQEPSGKETRLEAVGPGLFEIPQILSAGNVRFMFSRDASGKVNAMIRLAHTIVTMVKMP